MRTRNYLLISLLVAAFALPATAQRRRGPGKPTPPRTEAQCKHQTGDALEACKVLGTYLDRWKEQKWAQTRPHIHPMTMERIATAKKNMGEERHAMAPWYWAQEFYILNDWEMESIRPSHGGTFEVNTTEIIFQVLEDGFVEGEPASYLVGKKDGRWYVVDRRAGGGGFTEDAIRIGMKGFFDEVETPAPAAEASEAAEAEKPAPPALEIAPRQALEDVLEK